ncbi:YggT family protein [Candidatus Parcubacteria bacterium]|uniref:YggT family protein n=1 Tax=Candidatus Kaiserbacteria bacterium CG10_big_fil_rev_8_21_14_0_10_47_16 TaxID=1974608 RepID=A0A2H0UG08_9BACT|nr:YggT family protein [Candidatus Parcubacteria bacterium]PIR84735.1 MAG: YggT family protein [Candidatus Kaiserbacteria bacterium CG10_big_fil_rev_8_21_14_0_10_47_16]
MNTLPNAQEKALYQMTRVVWYIFSVVEALLILRLILRLFGANAGAQFTQIVYSISGVLVAPFQFVFSTPTLEGSALELNTILAILVYWFVAWGIIRLILMTRPVTKYEAHSELSRQDEV